MKNMYNFRTDLALERRDLYRKVNNIVIAIGNITPEITIPQVVFEEFFIVIWYHIEYTIGKKSNISMLQ